MLRLLDREGIDPARARARVRLIVTGALAWLAERMRRTTSPHGEALAAAMAVLVLVNPFWHRGVDTAPRAPGAPSRLAVVDAPGTTPSAGGTGALGAGPSGMAPRGETPVGGAGHDDAGEGTGPKSGVGQTGNPQVPDPAQTQGPSLISGGGLTITYTPGDPVGDTIRCLQAGGPNVFNGGC